MTCNNALSIQICPVTVEPGSGNGSGRCFCSGVQHHLDLLGCVLACIIAAVSAAAAAEGARASHQQCMCRQQVLSNASGATQHCCARHSIAVRNTALLCEVVKHTQQQSTHCCGPECIADA